MVITPTRLSSTVDDHATLVDTLVPWTPAAIYMASTVGVDTLEFLPWAMFCYLSIPFAILWGYTGFGIARLVDQTSK